MFSSDDIMKKISELPPELQQEVADIVDYLTSKSKHERGRKLKLDWAGGLKDFRDQFTSMELQKKGLEWWEKD
jgi:hypothetical protein